jgi:hypothetical protein
MRKTENERRKESERRKYERGEKSEDEKQKGYGQGGEAITNCCQNNPTRAAKSIPRWRAGHRKLGGTFYAFTIAREVGAGGGT